MNSADTGSAQDRSSDCCGYPPCEREDCPEAVGYREWRAWWASASDEERAEDLYWQAVYASENH